MIETLADGIEITIKCDKGHKTKKPLSWFVNNSSFKCAACGIVVDLTDVETRNLFKRILESTSKFGPFGTLLS